MEDEFQCSTLSCSNLAEEEDGYCSECFEKINNGAKYILFICDLCGTLLSIEDRSKKAFL